MSSKEAKKRCTKFEPQAWRKSLCKNCFKTKGEHGSEEDEDDQKTTTDSEAESGVDDVGDKIFIRRRSFTTPPKDCVTSPDVLLGSSGRSGRSTPELRSGRATPEPGTSSKVEAKKEAVNKAEAKTTSGNASTSKVEPKKDGFVKQVASVSKSDAAAAMKQGASAVKLDADTKQQGFRRFKADDGGANKKGFEGPGSKGAGVASPTIILPSTHPLPIPNETQGWPSGEKEREKLTEKGSSEVGLKKTNEVEGKTNDEIISGAKNSTDYVNDATDSVVNRLTGRNVTLSSAAEAGDGGGGGGGGLGDVDKSVQSLDGSIAASGTPDKGSRMRDGNKNNVSSSSSNADANASNTEITLAAASEGGTITPQLKSQSLNSTPIIPSPSPSVGAQAKNSCGLRHVSPGSEREAFGGAERGGGGREVNAEVNKTKAFEAETAAENSEKKLLLASEKFNNKTPFSNFQIENNNSDSSTSKDEEVGSAFAASAIESDRREDRIDSEPCSTASRPEEFRGGEEKEESSRSSSSSSSSSSCCVTLDKHQQEGEQEPGASLIDHRTTSTDHRDNSLTVVDETPSCPALTSSVVSTSSQLTSPSAAGGRFQFVDVSDSRLSYNVIDDVRATDFYYAPPPPPAEKDDDEERGITAEGVNRRAAAAGKGVTSLFHHLPSEDGNPEEESVKEDWEARQPPPSWSQTDDDLVRYSSQEGSSPQPQQQQQQPGQGSRGRRRRSKVIDTNDLSMMSAIDFNRSDAMMEGQRMLMDSLREKVSTLQEQCERMEREKGALSDLLSAKKSDYEMMKDHFNSNIGNLEMEVQRLKSEKSRLLDKLQLPESERASLAAEENEIADLKRRLEEYENRYSDVVGENEDLKQEVRDLQLEMEEMHDQFREEETIEFRELQKELENTAKNCRILQFKLRKAERRIEQMDSDRIQYDEKLKHFESCFQSSDDKRRIRVLEDDLRIAKDSAMRLHAELEKAEDRKLKYQEELDRAKNQMNDADNKRLCLQNDIDSMKHEMAKLRDQLRHEDKTPDAMKVSSPFKIVSDVELMLNQLKKDLKDSLERENDMKEQLKFSEEENQTMRKKLSEMEAENESMSLQLKKLSSAKSGRYTKTKGGEPESEEVLTERESELRLQMELAEQEVKILKRKMDELQQDNDNLLCAIKYLRSKLEQRDGSRCATPMMGDSKNTKDLLLRIGATTTNEEDMKRQLEESKKEVMRLTERINKMEEEEKLKNKTQESASKDKNLETTVVELEMLLMQEKEKCEKIENEKKIIEENQIKEINQQLSDSKKEHDKTKDELALVKSELMKIKEDAEQSKKASDEFSRSFEEIKSLEEFKTKFEDLQKTYNSLQIDYDKMLKEKDKQPKASVPLGSSGTKEPASWRWEKQDLEKQIKELNKKLEDLESKKSQTKIKNGKDDSGKQAEEKEKLEKDLKDLNKNLELISKEKDQLSADKKKLKQDLDGATKEKEELLKEKEELASEKKKVTKERDAALKENENLVKQKENDEVAAGKTLPKLKSFGKSSETVDAAKVKELTEALEKKDGELKALKKSGKKEKKMEEELEKVEKEKEGLKTEVTELKEKLKTGEDTWSKERSKLEQELKGGGGGKLSTVKGFRGLDDTKSAQEKETLIKEKLKLIEEVTKLKKDLTESKQKNAEKEDFEKTMKDRNKTIEELQKEVEKLKLQLAEKTGSKISIGAAAGSTSASKVITIPVQQDRSVKTIPIQKLCSRSSSISSEDQDTAANANVAVIEEMYKSKTKNLEEELSLSKEHMAALKKENETLAKQSQKSFADLKENFEKETKSWIKEKELLKKSIKLAEEEEKKVSLLDKNLEETKEKLKREEAKRRELEMKIKVLENDSKTTDKTTTEAAEDKSKVTEDKTTTASKPSDFRNRFEKFGGTPRPLRKLSLPSSSSSSEGGGEKGDWASEVQKQAMETEKARLKDKEEMMEKLEKQKKEFQLKIDSFKKTNELLESKAEELTSSQKKILDLHCDFEEERSKWLKERTKLEKELNDLQKTKKDEKNKASELNGEAKKLQLSISTKSNSASSGTTTPITPSTPLGLERLGFKSRTTSFDNSTTSVIIPVRKAEDEKKGEDGGTNNNGGVGKLSKKLFPFGQDASQTSSTAKTLGQRTPIPINRIGKLNPPKT